LKATSDEREEMGEIKRALISVSDKNGILEFAKKLAERGVAILSTGGTEKLLKEKGVAVTPVSDYTGFPEIMDGRVKTLHPKIHGAILGRRDIKGHMDAMSTHGIEAIDMVVVNLYPFERTVANPKSSREDIIENIDIGGPSMLRSAAKNHNDVVVVVDASDYDKILSEMEDNNGQVSQETRFALAGKAFTHTARYDSMISNYFESVSSKEEYPEIINRSYSKIAGLRYGENPHQSAAFYKEIGTNYGISGAEQLNGKELSYNNILDLSATVELVSEFKETTAVIIKHTNPCGAASNESLLEAYRMARETDPVSAFGGIVGFNRKVDKATAEELAATFLEVVAAPDYAPEALEILKGKKNLRVLRLPIPITKVDKVHNVRSVAGGLLVQGNDSLLLNEGDLKVVTERAPTDKEREGMIFAWKIAKHVKSNAIIFADRGLLIAVGAGQMSRVDSSRIAVMKATRPVKGTVLASDAFFPFRDAIDTAAEAGVTAIIQPGGSIRDEEVIAAANEHNIAMLFTGVRHFRH